MKAIFYLTLSIGFLFTQITNAQNTFPSTGSVGIGTTSPASSSLLEIKSTAKGLLIPRLTQTQKNAIASPVTGLLIYQTDNYPGFYYYDGSAWSIIGYWKRNGTSVFFNTGNVGFGTLSPAYKIDVKGGDINLSAGNALRMGGIKVLRDDPPNQNLFVGDNADSALSTGYDNTAVGSLALKNNKTGTDNTALGTYSLVSNTSGNSNTAIGSQALISSTGSANTALGYQSLYDNTTGAYNTASGYQAMIANSTGIENTAFGGFALQSNQSGSYNTAVGIYALGFRSYYTSGNTAVGAYCAYSNYSGTQLTVVGDSALYNNYTGSANTSIGNYSLMTNSEGSLNTAVGVNALKASDADDNTAIGVNALLNNSSGNENTSIGSGALYDNTTGNGNTAIGYLAGVTDGTISNASAVGNYAKATASNQVMLGNTSVTSVKAAGSFVIYSDGRFKKNINTDVPGLAFIKQLKPVTYNYDIHGLNNHIKGSNNDNQSSSAAKQQNENAINAKEKIKYTGFVAQDVEAAAKKINYDFSGLYKPQNDHDAYGLSYADFVVPLVKAVQELDKLNSDKTQQIDSLEYNNKILTDKLSTLSDKVSHVENAMSQCCSSFSSNMQISNLQTGLTKDAARLDQNIPNPFNGSSSISYYIPSGIHTAQLMITDVAGHVLKTYTLPQTGYGKQTTSSGELASGTYQYSLLIDGKLIDTKKMVLSR